MKKKVSILALIAVTAAALACARPHNTASPGAKASNAAIPAASNADANVLVREEAVSKDVSESYAVTVSSESGPLLPVEFVTIPGGKFMMGADASSGGSEDARPAHEVSLKTFELSKTAVTVAQYAECVAKGRCVKPGSGESCNWDVPGRQLHPVNCVDWEKANQYARFKGARLPSESEWEYAARSGGRNRKYPWGDDEPTCDRAVMKGNGGFGCGANGTLPVCSKPAGNSAQGLCDMAGNVWQWVADKYQGSYEGAPADGGAFEGAGSARVLRGGSFGRGGPGTLRADFRGSFAPDKYRGSIGFRLARPAPRKEPMEKIE